MSKVTTTPTRFAGLAVRHYSNVVCVGVPGDRKPFKDSWFRFVDAEVDTDVGPIFKKKAEILTALPEYAAGYGITEG